MLLIPSVAIRLIYLALAGRQWPQIMNNYIHTPTNCNLLRASYTGGMSVAAS